MTREGVELERFGEFMDDFIRKNYVSMLVSKAEGSDDWTYHCSLAGGPVMELFIAMQIIPEAFRRMRGQMGDLIGEDDYEQVADGILGMVKDGIMAAIKERKEEDEYEREEKNGADHSGNTLRE